MNFTGLSETDVAFLIKQNHPAVDRVAKSYCRLFYFDGDGVAVH